MECLDEVTCRGISCPTKPTYKYHILFSSYLPSSITLSFLSVPLLNYCRDQLLSFTVFFFTNKPIHYNL